MQIVNEPLNDGVHENMKRERYTKITDFIGSFSPIYSIEGKVLREPDYASVWPMFREAYLKRVQKAPHRTATEKWAWVFGEINGIVFSHEELPEEVLSGRFLDLLQKLKQIDFQTEKRLLQEVHLYLNGIINGHYQLVRKEDRLHRQITTAEQEEAHILKQEEKDLVLNKWRALHTEEWMKNYYGDRRMQKECDLKWDLSIQYEDGAAAIYRGMNAFPARFQELLALFEIELNRTI